MASTIISQTAESAKNAKESVDSLGDAVSEFNKILTGNGGLEELPKVINEITKTGNQAAQGLGNLTAITGVGKIVFGAFATAIDAVGDVASNLVNLYNQATEAVDSFSEVHRDLDREMYDAQAQFGGTLDAAKEYTDYLLKTQSKVGNVKFGFINHEEIKQATEAMTNVGLSLDYMDNNVISSAGSMDLLTTSIMHAKSIGMEASQYYEMLGDAIRNQGLDSQAAVEQIAMFSDISKETGLTIEDVAGTMKGLSSNFSKLGMNADFSRPILENFTKTVTKMGLGIENAKDLTTSFSSALAGIPQNYGMASIVSQMGGLDYGKGGTVFGAGIDMQAKMLKAQKTGDQSAMGLELAKAMSDTLEKMSGKGLITVEQASQDSSLESLYITQTSLLQSLFGVSQDDSAATIDMLKNIDSATKSGDENLASSLAEQLTKGRDVAQETLSAQEKSNAILQASLALGFSQSRFLSEIAGHTGDELVNFIDQKSAIASDEIIRLLQENKGSMKDLDIPNFTNNLLENISNKASEAASMGVDLSSQAYEYGAENFNYDALDTAGEKMEGLMVKIDSLVTTLGTYINSNNSRPGKISTPGSGLK